MSAADNGRVFLRVPIRRDDLRAIDRIASETGAKREAITCDLVHAALLDGTQPVPRLPDHEPVAPTVDFVAAHLREALENSGVLEALLGMAAPDDKP